MKHIFILLFSLGFLANCSIAQTSLSDRATAALKRAIGDDISGFKTYSYPTNNYGVGTTCLRKWDPNGAMLCDMIKCFGLSQISDSSLLWKTVNGHAYYGIGPGLTVDDTLNKTYGVGLVLPKLLKVLNINADYSNSSTVSVQLSIDSAQIRRLDFEAYKRFILSQGEETIIRKAYNSGKIVVATADFVLLDYSLDITPRDQLGVDISLKLDSILRISPKFQLTGENTLGAKIERKASGHYIISSTKPVVFAVYVKKQKQLAVKGNETSFDEWDLVADDKVNDPTIK